MTTRGIMFRTAIAAILCSVASINPLWSQVVYVYGGAIWLFCEIWVKEIWGKEDF